MPSKGATRTKRRLTRDRPADASSARLATSGTGSRRLTDERSADGASVGANPRVFADASPTRRRGWRSLRSQPGSPPTPASAVSRTSSTSLTMARSCSSGSTCTTPRRQLARVPRRPVRFSLAVGTESHGGPRTARSLGRGRGAASGWRRCRFVRSVGGDAGAEDRVGFILVPGGEPCVVRCSCRVRGGPCFVRSRGGRASRTGRGRGWRRCVGDRCGSRCRPAAARLV
jgi:hypothetical protein